MSLRILKKEKKKKVTIPQLPWVGAASENGRLRFM